LPDPLSGGGSSGGSLAGSAPERPTGPLTLSRDAPRLVELDAGQTHEWGIELTAGESVDLSITADAPRCSGWTWGFYNPTGDALAESPMTANPAGHWSLSRRQAAVSSVGGAPLAGRYSVRVQTPSDCPLLRYTLTAR